MLEVFPPGISTRHGRWERCYREIKVLLTGSAEPGQQMDLNVDVRVESNETVGKAVVSLMKVAITGGESTGSPVYLSNAAIRINQCCFLVHPQPGRLVSLAAPARHNVVSALRHKFATTRDVAARCLATVRDSQSRELLQQAVAKESVPWTKANMQAALNLNLNELNDEHPTEPGITKTPCANCGALILPITAERTGGFCMPCSKGKRRR
jgi:hypothetical protein